MGISYLILLVALFVILEIVLRNIRRPADPFYLYKRVPNFFIPQAYPVHKQYEQEIIYQNKKNLVEISFNNYGFRGEHITNLEDSIVIVGDSFTLSGEVSQPNTFCSLLKNKLGREVVNAGKSNATTCYFLPLLANRVVHMKPKSIIIISSVTELKLETEKSYIHLHAEMKDSTWNQITWVLTESAVVCYFLHLLSRRNFDIKTVKGNVLRMSKNYDFQLTTEGRPHTMDNYCLEGMDRNLQSLIAICKIHQIQLGLVWASNAFQALKQAPLVIYHRGWDIADLQHRSELTENLLKTRALQDSIPFLSLREFLTQENYWLDEVHLTEEGSKVVANQLEKFVDKNFF